MLSLASGEKLEGEWKNGEISENGDDGNEYLSSVSGEVNLSRVGIRIVSWMRRG